MSGEFDALCEDCGEPVEPGTYCECREGYGDDLARLSWAERSRNAITEGMGLS